MKDFPYTPDQLEQIRMQRKVRAAKEPHLNNAHFVSETGCFVFEWRTGATAVVPARSLAALSNATVAQLAEVHVIDEGRGVEWPELDVQMTTTALLQVAFGIRSVQVAGHQGGSSRSSAKVAASRANGSKGGRPRKQLVAA